jgi:hypothetical protein
MKSFRNWLEDLWRENCDEHDSWSQPRYTLEEYFSRYKWWLRREYRFQQRNLK